MHTKKSSARRSGEGGQCRSWPEALAKEQPTKTVVTALGVGMLLTLLPIGRIVGMLVDVAFALVRPVLLFAGLLKLSEFCRSGSLVGERTEAKQPIKSKT